MPTTRPLAPKSQRAWDAFQARVTELGGEVLADAWLGSSAPHRVRCAVGHERLVRPNCVQQGRGICHVCAGNDPRAAWDKFRARVAELGGVVLEETWLGNNTYHRVRCAAGHECSPRPTSVRGGGGLCRTCVGQDPRAAEATFRARVAELGGVVLEAKWLGSLTPHRVRCAAGHEGRPQPNHVMEGTGICRVCARQVWDVFYVVHDDDADHIKFGITSGDPRPRLREHARGGFTAVIRILEDLPGTTAPDMERLAISTLRLAGETPVRGREYYAANVLPVVLDVVDNYPHMRMPAPARARPRVTLRAGGACAQM